MEQGVLYHLGVSKRLKQLHDRLAQRGDSEHEQAILRIAIGFIASVYVSSPNLSALDERWEAIMQWTAVGFMAAAIGLFIAIVVSPGASPIRRYLGMLVDLGTTSFVVAVTGESGTPLMAVYLWVTTGNGFRYGLRYLTASASLSLLGFGVAYWASDFWHLHPIFVVSMAIVLVVIPGYMAALLNKLNHAIGRAKEANQAKSQFLANMSHELRTPLNGVIGTADLLMDSQLSKEQRELAGTIQTSANTLFGIIENILDFSKIEAGRITLESTVFDLHSFFADTTQMFASQARRKGLRYACHIDPRLPYLLKGDPQHTRQVLINLIGNAIKFTARGGVEVRAFENTNDRAHGRVWMRLEIEDTGIGIASENQQKIFESFQQADPSTARRFGGTGLGTTIARQLVELMGGHIGFKSQLGKGTLFWVELPFARTETSEYVASSSLRDLGILVLSDNETYADLSRYFRDWGLGCDLTHSLEATVAAVWSAEQTNRNVNVVLVECCHVGIDPAEVATAFRDRNLIGKTSLVLLATPTEKYRETEFLDAGFACVLYTPVDKPLLYNAVHAVQASFRMPDNVVSLAQHYREHLGAGAEGLNILLAEDNETNQRVIRGILERVGHRVVAVGDGEIALDRLAMPDAAFDLLILDMNMPGRGGLEVFKASRFLDPDRLIPALVLTAEATQEAMDACRQAGVDAFLTKPVQARTLLETVARLAKDRARSDGSGVPRGTDKTLPRAVSVGTTGKLLVDQDKLAELVSLSPDPEFFTDLLGSFSRDVGKAIQRLASAIEGTDYPAMREAVHALQGSASEMGAVRLTELCNELRKLKPFEMGSGKPGQLVAQVREVFDRTCVALTEFPSRRHDAST